MDLFSVLGLAVVVFASTNIDDVFVLLGFLADPKFKLRQVIIGQYLGIAALFAASVIASLVSLALPPQYVGLLGLLPILIGLKKLYELSRPEADDGDVTPPSAGGNILAVAAVTVANGGDNIGVYTPLFAIRSPSEIVLFGVVFFAMTALWITAAHWMVNHPKAGAPIRRYGPKVVPVVLIALGLLIMYEADSFNLL